ncbi:hypothetical protein niasHS_010255 [Heterodera schachtii]|uniref:Mothers against decapentaplegic homolog n=1 Tax=Heterodera schachtii TaxID=97005 RepID=A0ABD2J0Y5_HETSC
MNLFTSLDPSVKKLLGWKMGDEEEKWALKAVESLVKKMQKRKHQGYGTVEDLEYALSHPGSSSNCVTIPRSLDGRLQVSHRKGLPHVIYCRVWRWPNLQSTTDCMFPYDGRSEQICINPYHYHRIEMLGQSKPVPPPSSSSSVVPSSSFSPSSASIGTFSTLSPSAAASLPSASPSASSVSSASPSVPSFRHVHSYPQITHQQFISTNVISDQSALSSASPTAALFTQSPSALSDDDDFMAQQQQRHNAALQQQLCHHSQPCCWCSICYYELNSRVGEPFKVLESIVVIDGFTNPSGAGRICLGLLSNVNRNATIENTRRHIGMGIRLMCTDNNVLLLNQSETAVFVQSRNANFKYSLQPTAVCRVPPGATMLIFDFHLFAGMLEKAKENGYQHVYEIVKMCFVRLSFVKGWGADYPRSDVTSTPCWLEIQLHQPMAWTDAALSQLDPPDHNGVTSVS